MHLLLHEVDAVRLIEAIFSKYLIKESNKAQIWPMRILSDGHFGELCGFFLVWSVSVRRFACTQPFGSQRLKNTGALQATPGRKEDRGKRFGSGREAPGGGRRGERASSSTPWASGGVHSWQA
jgi:hypothetical protein